MGGDGGWLVRCGVVAGCCGEAWDETCDDGEMLWEEMQKAKKVKEHEMTLADD